MGQPLNRCKRSKSGLSEGGDAPYTRRLILIRATYEEGVGEYPTPFLLLSWIEGELLPEDGSIQGTVLRGANLTQRSYNILREDLVLERDVIELGQHRINR